MHSFLTLDVFINPSDTLVEIAYGSTVTLKSNMRAGGLLHSHVQRFPSGSEQQQVTTYHHKDSNNEWKILKPWNQPEPEGIEFIKDGAVIRISHASTEKNLHSHAVKAPVTSGENEVSAYGNLTIGDSNDHWKVELVDVCFHSSFVRNRLTAEIGYPFGNRQANTNPYDPIPPAARQLQMPLAQHGRNFT